MREERILEIENLRVSFFTDYGEVKAVRGVSLYLNKGEVVGIVGESGCGKSVTALSILRLISFPGRILEGKIKFHNRNLLEISEREINKIRGAKISMIFQEPLTALNPVFKIKEQMGEVFKTHTKLGEDEIYKRSKELLTMVNIPEPDVVLDSYPHQLSGGMRQRVMIAMAIALNPEIIIADEPTTALDVTVQAYIIDILKNLQKQKNISLLFITHDFGLVEEIADRIYVMYAGEIIESGTKKDIFNNPMHPYTQGLFRSIPGFKKRYKKLIPIPGNVPDGITIPSGCPFHPRCEKVMEICKKQLPPVKKVNTHLIKCHLY